MTYTELDDLKAAWQTLNRNLERQNSLAFHEFRERKLGRFRSIFRPLVTGQIIQIIAGAVLALIGGSFWFDHLGVAHLMIYGISLHLYGLMLIIFGARDLFLIRQADYAAPVVALQRQLAAIRTWHLQMGLWFGIAGCFIWVPAMLVLFYALGADVWTHNPSVVGWFVLSSFVCLAIFFAIVWVSRRPGREKLARGLDNSAAGSTLRRAQSLLEEVAQFESE